MALGLNSVTGIGASLVCAYIALNQSREDWMGVANKILFSVFALLFIYGAFDTSYRIALYQEGNMTGIDVANSVQAAGVRPAFWLAFIYITLIIIDLMNYSFEKMNKGEI
jgi:hypothetical protein